MNKEFRLSTQFNEEQKSDPQKLTLENLGFKRKKAINYLTKFKLETIRAKISSLEKLGIVNGVEILDQCPQLMNVNFENISDDLENLKGMGFYLPSLIEGYPEILFRKNLNALKKIFNYLQELGFKDPQALIMQYPKQIIEKLGIRNISWQIERLKKRGFTKPQIMMEYFFKRDCYHLNFSKIDETIKKMKALKFNNPILTIERYPSIIYANLEEKIDFLKRLGFTNPLRLIQIFPILVHIKIEDRLQELKNIGFKDPIKCVERDPRLLKRNVKTTIEKLKAHGFDNPVELIERIPIFAFRNIGEIITKFKQIGITEPVRLIQENPSIIAYTNRLEPTIKALEKIGVNKPLNVIIKDRYQTLLKYYNQLESFIERLTNLGFHDPIKLITKYPPILGSKIEERIQNLKNMGFHDPVRIIEILPSVSRLNIKRIFGMMKELGFSNPVKVLEYNPYFFGFSLETFKKRLSLLRKIDKRFNLNLFDSVKNELSEENLIYLSVSNLKLIFSLRLAIYLNDKRHLKEFTTYNPFISYYILKLLNQNKIQDEAYNFRSLMNKYKRNLTKTAKESLILEVKNSLDKDIAELKNKLIQDPQNEKIRNLLKVTLLLKRISSAK